MVNPATLLTFKKKWEEFSQRHSGFSQFIQAAASGGLGEGNILDVKITMPDGRTLQSNMKITAEDVEMIKSLTK